jgi:2-amino-4-hydroxy-6-hydroxymethyldihydropteridine diphosphokinase
VTRAYIGLGANLGDRVGTIRRALSLLAADAEIDVVAVSTLRETDPVGYLEQPRFVNGVAAVETELPARALLTRLLDVERALGRTREGPRHGPRTIDVDVLLLGDLEHESDRLRIPHRDVLTRRFVLAPLVELDPELRLPDGTRLADALAALEGQRVERVEEL